MPQVNLTNKSLFRRMTFPIPRGFQSRICTSYVIWQISRKLIGYCQADHLELHRLTEESGKKLSKIPYNRTNSNTLIIAQKTTNIARSAPSSSSTCLPTRTTSLTPKSAPPVRTNSTKCCSKLADSKWTKTCWLDLRAKKLESRWNRSYRDLCSRFRVPFTRGRKRRSSCRKVLSRLLITTELISWNRENWLIRTFRFKVWFKQLKNRTWTIFKTQGQSFCLEMLIITSLGQSQLSKKDQFLPNRKDFLSKISQDKLTKGQNRSSI